MFLQSISPLRACLKKTFFPASTTQCSAFDAASRRPAPQVAVFVPHPFIAAVRPILEVSTTPCYHCLRVSGADWRCRAPASKSEPRFAFPATMSPFVQEPILLGYLPSTFPASISSLHLSSCHHIFRPPPYLPPCVTVPFAIHRFSLASLLSRIFGDQHTPPVGGCR